MISGITYVEAKVFLGTLALTQPRILALCAMQPHVREVFDISGFLAILTVVDTRQDAVAKVA